MNIYDIIELFAASNFLVMSMKDLHVSLRAIEDQNLNILLMVLDHNVSILQWKIYYQTGQGDGCIIIMKQSNFKLLQPRNHIIHTLDSNIVKLFTSVL